MMIKYLKLLSEYHKHFMNEVFLNATLTHHQVEIRFRFLIYFKFNKATWLFF